MVLFVFHSFHFAATVLNSTCTDLPQCTLVLVSPHGTRQRQTVTSFGSQPAFKPIYAEWFPRKVVLCHGCEDGNAPPATESMAARGTDESLGRRSWTRPRVEPLLLLVVIRLGVNGAERRDKPLRRNTTPHARHTHTPLTALRTPLHHTTYHFFIVFVVLTHCDKRQEQC